MSEQTLTLNLDAGTHYICSCGLSKNHPYCDGSHKGTEKTPKVVKLDTPQTIEITV